MAEFFQQLLVQVSAHPGWAGVIVFFIALAESLAIVGVIVPGVAILFGVGAMIGAGALNFWAMCGWAVAGAVLGDGLSFWLGRHYKQQLTSMWPFSRHPATLQKGIRFFDRYGGKSVALGRFFGPIRAVIPLVAGMLEMPALRFLLANVLSALAWAPAYLLPGMVFGASLELASEIAVSLATLIILLVGLLWFLGWASHRIFLFLQPRSQQMLQNLLRLGQRNRWLAEMAGALGDPRHPEARGLAALAGLVVMGSLALVALSLIPGRPLEFTDDSLRFALQGLNTPTGDRIMLAISALADNVVTLAALFGVWLTLKASGTILSARHWLAGLGLAWLAALAGEYVLLRNPGLISVIPDVYALRGGVLYGLAAIILAGALPMNRRWLIYSAATIVIVAIAFAQLYHGSHLSAVLHALVLGLIWSTAVGVAYRTHSRQEPLQKRQLIAVGTLVLLLGLGSFLSTGAPPARPAYNHMPAVMAAEKWWQSDWASLPAARDDLAHTRKHPLNLQYSGGIGRLGDALISAGWQQLPRMEELEALKMLSPSTPLEELPLLPHSHEGRYETHRFSMNLPDSRLALRLWSSHIILTPGGHPLWIGSVSQLQRKQQLGLVSYLQTQPDYRKPLQLLQSGLTGSDFVLRPVRNGEGLLLRPGQAEND